MHKSKGAVKKTKTQSVNPGYTERSQVLLMFQVTSFVTVVESLRFSVA